jgi:hypothetical protein
MAILRGRLQRAGAAERVIGMAPVFVRGPVEVISKGLDDEREDRPDEAERALRVLSSCRPRGATLRSERCLGADLVCDRNRIDDLGAIVSQVSTCISFVFASLQPGRVEP